ncbi:MAG TPA: hypothetical protein VFO29_02490 [Candidatus Rubrimentiphilum sp.]|nr:hypothetical protein [Candidatus Rubrimentiphilum sp.]
MRAWVLVSAALVLALSSADAASSIVTVYVTTKTPAANQPISVEVGVTADDAGGWAATDYAFTLRLRSSDGSIAAESPAIPGTQPVQPGHVTLSIARWTLPAGLSGYYKLEVTLLHGGTVLATSSPIAVIVAQASQPPAPSCVHGSTNSTDNFGQQQSETILFSFNGCLPGNGSYSLTEGFSSAPSSVQPVLELDTSDSRFRGGALTPQIDPLALNNVSGYGASFQQNWGTQHSLEATWLREQGTPAGPSVAALQYTVRSPTLVAGLNAGHIRSPSVPDYGGLSNWGDGNFATLSLTWQPPPQRQSFGFRFGLVNYMDADGLTRRVDRAYEALATLSIGATQWTLDEFRTGPFYVAPGAPGIIADRDAQRLAGSFPLGQAAVTLSVEGYHDDLPGADLSVRTNNWTENATFSIPVRNDVATLTFTGGSQQQSGDFPSTYATNGVAAVYLLRRGAQSVQLSYGVVGATSGPDQQQTQVQSGITVSRVVAEGLSVTLGTNLAGVRASSMDSASFNRTNFVTFSYSRNPWTLSTSLSNSAMQPGTGDAPPQTLSLNEGIQFNLPSHLALKFSMTKINGQFPASTGNIALGTQF